MNSNQANHIVIRTFTLALFGGLLSLYINGNNQKPFVSFQTINLVRTIIDPEGEPSPTLKKILQLFDVHHEPNLKSIVDATQREFLRPAGKERWEIEEKISENTEQALQLFDQLGLVKEVKPLHQEYEYALLMGALVSRVRTRLVHLVELHKQGIKCDRIVMLGGKRPLNENLESADVLLNPDYPINPAWKKPTSLPKTELEMMQFVYEQMDLPQNFRAIPIDFVDAPMLKNDDGTERRPSTADTVAQWLQSKPKRGKVLIISNQPYVGYQDAVGRLLLPEGQFYVDSVGKASQEKNLAIYIDTIARWLYTEKNRLKK